MATKAFVADKDTVRAKEGDHPQAKDGGGERHLLAGAYKGFVYTSYVKFRESWGGVAKIQKAYLVLRTERNAHDGFPSTNSGIKVFRLAGEFPDPNEGEPEGAFVGRYPVEGKDQDGAANGVVDSGDAEISRINITELVSDMAPRSVKRPNGRPGGNKAHHGFAIERRTTNAQNNPHMCVGGVRHPDTSYRPYIELIYDPTKSENSVSTVGPTGNVNNILNENFEGVFTIGANQPADVRPARWEIELYKAGGAKPIWSYGAAASPSDALGMTCTVPLSLVGTTDSRYKFESGTDYEWRLRAKDNKGVYTDWSGKPDFTIQTLPPTLSNLLPSATPALETLNNVSFQAAYSDPDGNPLLGFRVQLRTQTSPTDPLWDQGILWDSGPVAGGGLVAPTPGQPVEVKLPYGGIGLEPGVYSWRIHAWDVLSAYSAWAYSEVEVTKGWEPDPGDVEYLTGYANRRLKARILIKGMLNKVQKVVLTGNPPNGKFKLNYGGELTDWIAQDASAGEMETALRQLPNLVAADFDSVTKAGDSWTIKFTGRGKNRPLIKHGAYSSFAADERIDVYSDRAPGWPVAVIEDAANIGATEMYNDGGEFYFSLPAIHPQVAVIEPYQVHYALEVFRGESWREIAAGYITDFDATDTDVVFYGQDYMAILGRQVDERFNKQKVADAEAVLWPDKGGGSKYVNRTIKQIIQDQLDRSIHDTGSPLAFFTRGALPTMSDPISIFVSFKERLPFIAGLIQSHRQGSNKRTRLYAKRVGDGQYQWTLVDAPGKDKRNIRMEYGGLVQGFRVVPFGDFATRLNAIGRLYNSSRMTYTKVAAPTPEGEDAGWYEETYGRFAKATIYEDITNESDLQRRAKQEANKISRVGKQLALNLRPGSFAIKDGWDICDNILVDINRGVVSTTRMGSGLWTIWGWTWELKPNGQEFITLSVLPKEDKSAPDADLIPAVDINSTGQEWQIRARDPDDLLDETVFTHVNSDTGHIFERDPSTGEWKDMTLDLPLAPTILNDGGIDAARMATSYKAVWVGESLPSLPDPLYPPGALASEPSSTSILRVDDTGMEWVGASAVPIGPPNPADGLPPPPVAGFTVTPAYQQQGDGTDLPTLTCVWSPFEPDVPDVIGYELEWDEGSYTYPVDLPPLYAAADFVAARSLRVSRDSISASLAPVISGATYDVRIRAYDMEGKVGTWVTVSEKLALPDSVAPAAPVISAYGGYKMVGASWDANGEADFSHFEVEYHEVKDPALTEWQRLEARATRIIISDLYVFPGTPAIEADPDAVPPIEAAPAVPAGTLYEMRVRSFDLSGNASAWSNTEQATATLVGQADVVFSGVLARTVSADAISADDIKAGTLSVGGEGTDGLRIFNADGEQIGAWGEFGWIVADPHSPHDAIWSGRDEADPSAELGIFFSNQYVWDGLKTSPIEAGIPISPWQAAITPRGINAEAILFGAVGGGDNRILNAGVELQAYPTVALVGKTWTDAADWEDVLAGSINLNVATDDLKMGAT